MVAGDHLDLDAGAAASRDGRARLGARRIDEADDAEEVELHHVLDGDFLAVELPERKTEDAFARGSGTRDPVVLPLAIGRAGQLDQLSGAPFTKSRFSIGGAVQLAMKRCAASKGTASRRGHSERTWSALRPGLHRERDERPFHRIALDDPRACALVQACLVAQQPAADERHRRGERGRIVVQSDRLDVAAGT